MTQADALSIYQQVLDILSDALLDGDANAFRRYIHLPHSIVTEEFSVTLETEDELRVQFIGFTAALGNLRVDDYTRTARTATFEGPDRIVGTHVSYLTEHGKLVVPEFEGSIILEKRIGQWGCVQILHHMRYASWPELRKTAGRPDG